METDKRPLKQSDDWGVPAKIEHRYTTDDPIEYPVVETEHPSSLRMNFTPKLRNTPGSQPPEVVQLRNKSGMKTKGDVICSPPTPKTEAERTVADLKRTKGGKCGDWGGGIDQSNNYC
jgi:hypothetical protein